MKEKYRIAILGIGGVGGYFGGMLAKHYVADTEIEITFICRGQNLMQIKQFGLKLQLQHATEIVRPDIVTDAASLQGYLDLLICCTKSYDLEDGLAAISKNVTAKTIILPLLNGINIAERISKLFPQTTVLKGCVYCTARLILPGVVEDKGKRQLLYFGGNQSILPEINHIEQIFTAASISAKYEGKIERVLWEKFMFVSPVACLTTLYNVNIGIILRLFL